MIDEKDIEIAKLRGQVDALERMMKQLIAPASAQLVASQPIAILNGYYRCAGCGELVPNAAHYVHHCWSTTTIAPQVWPWTITSFSLTAAGACEPATDWTVGTTENWTWQSNNVPGIGSS